MSACLARFSSAAAVLVCLLAPAALAPAALAPAALADDLSARFAFAPITARPAEGALAPSAQDSAFVTGQNWPFDTNQTDAADNGHAGGAGEAWGNPGTKAERLQAMLQLAALWRF